MVPSCRARRERFPLALTPAGSVQLEAPADGQPRLGTGQCSPREQHRQTKEDF